MMKTFLTANNHFLKLKSIIIVLSAIVLSLLFSPADFISLAIILSVGGTVGFIAARLYNKRTAFNEFIKTSYLTAIILSLFVCFAGANQFYNSWEPSSKMQALISAVFADFRMGLKILSFIIAIAALPFTISIIASFVHGCLLVFASINYREIITNLFGQQTSGKRIRNTLCIVTSIIASAFIGTLLLCGVYLLPVDRIDNNVKKSALTIEDEGTYPSLSECFTSQLDNYTDSIMLLEAADDSDAPLLNKAMSMYRGRINGKNPAETLIAHYNHGKEFDSVISYSRYWHGYQVFLKPLLLLLDYNSIRIVNGILQVLIIGITCYLLFKNEKGFIILPFMIIYGMLMPVALAKSLQFSSCFYAFTIGIIALLLIKEEKLERWSKWVFLYIGIHTAFFDFLTYPIATFGIPAVFYLALTESETAEKRIGNLIRNGFFWVVGYGGMWFSKWVLASIITGENIIANGADAVIRRTSNIGADGIQQINLFNCEKLNYIKFFTTPVTILLIIYVLLLVLKLVLHKSKLTLADTGKIVLPYIIVGLAPVVWFSVATNHSQIHAWFTNKACAVSVLAICFALICVIRKSKDISLESQKG